MEPSLETYLALSGILFAIGAVGVIYKRNAIGMFMCIELMLNSVNLSFVAFSRHYGDVTGQLFVFVVMAVAACEAAVGLGIIITFFRNRESIDVDDASMMRINEICRLKCARSARNAKRIWNMPILRLFAALNALFAAIVPKK